MGVTAIIKTYIEIDSTGGVVGSEKVAYAPVRFGFSQKHFCSGGERTPCRSIRARRLPAIYAVWNLGRTTLLVRFDTPEAPLRPLRQLFGKLQSAAHLASPDRGPRP